jgi:hypothetical protein
MASAPIRSLPTPVNNPPVLAAIGNRTVTAGQLLQFTIYADDPDGDDLFYSAGNLPSGADFDMVTHIFSWTPAIGQEGDYPGVHFEVNDGQDYDSEDITVTVNADVGAPVLDSIGNRSVNEGELLEFTVTATDPNGDPLDYSTTNLPPGATFDTETQTFSWIPGFDQAGVYPGVHFEVTDGQTPDAEDITITVINVNRAPVLSPIGDRTVNEGDLLEFILDADDPDGDSLTFSMADPLPQ